MSTVFPHCEFFFFLMTYLRFSVPKFFLWSPVENPDHGDWGFSTMGFPTDDHRNHVLCMCVCVCVVLMIFSSDRHQCTAEREHEHWLASVAKRCVRQEAEQPVISAKTLMENLTQIEDTGAYAYMHESVCVHPNTRV